jgi:hypothetical protein
VFNTDSETNSNSDTNTDSNSVREPDASPTDYLKYLVSNPHSSPADFRCDNPELSNKNDRWCNEYNIISCGKQMKIGQFNVVEIDPKTKLFHGSMKLPTNTIPSNNSTVYIFIVKYIYFDLKCEC